MLVVFAGPLIVVGLLVLLFGGRLFWTGRNFEGFLGRGFTKGDELRTKRAPTAYFRALGAMAGIPGVLSVFFGTVLWLVPSRPDRRVAALVFAVAGLLIIAEVAAGVWVLLISSQYRLFRWDKP